MNFPVGKLANRPVPPVEYCANSNLNSLFCEGRQSGLTHLAPDSKDKHMQKVLLNFCVCYLLCS